MIIIATMVLFAAFAFIQKPQQTPITKKIVKAPTITPNPNGTVQLIVGISPNEKVWIRSLAKSPIPYPSKCDTTVKAPFIIMSVVSEDKKVLFTCKKATTLHGSSIPLVNDKNEIIEQAKQQDVQLEEISIFLPLLPGKNTLQLYDANGKLAIIEELVQI